MEERSDLTGVPQINFNELKFFHEEKKEEGPNELDYNKLSNQIDTFNRNVANICYYLREPSPISQLFNSIFSSSRK